MQGILVVLKLSACGACAAAVWSLLAAVHKAWELKGFLGAVMDFLSPIAFAAVIWFGVLFIMHGETRVYEFLCMGMGVVLYIFTVKKLFFELFYKVFADIRKFIGFIFKILLTPAQFLYKMLYVELYTKRRKVSAETEKLTDVPKG